MTFFDPDLMKFGNAMSPFVQMPSYESAQLAMQRPFEDRYNSRYDQPDWWGAYGDEYGLETRGEYVGGGPVLMRIGAAESVVDDPWKSQKWDRRALVASAVIAGLTTLFALREKDHAVEIIAVGAAGITLTWGLSASKNLTASR